VNKVLTNHRDKESLDKIYDLNEQIKLKNQEEGVESEKSSSFQVTSWSPLV